MFSVYNRELYQIFCNLKKKNWTNLIFLKIMEFTTLFGACTTYNHFFLIGGYFPYNSCVGFCHTTVGMFSLPS